MELINDVLQRPAYSETVLNGVRDFDGMDAIEFNHKAADRIAPVLA
jgi:hypothetical protein